MADHPNLELFRHVYNAFTSGDMDRLGELFADDVSWHTPGRNPLSGDFSGQDAVFKAFESEFELSGGTYEVEVDDVLVNDARIVAILRATAQREGKNLDERYVIVFGVRDGKVAEGREYWTDQSVLDAFWS